MVGRDVRPIVDLRGRMVEILVLSGLFVAPLLLAAGFAVSLGPLRRVDRLQRVALEIGSGRLAARMPIEGRGDELDLFAGTVNRMIGEVERTVDQVKSVTDAIAHDLRTPLTRVRNQLYRASRDPDMAPADVVRIEAAMADLDLVLARFAALLRISELEASGRRQGFATSRIDRLLDAVVELYGPLAEERDVALAMGRCGAGALVLRREADLRGLQQPCRQCDQVRAGGWVRVHPAGEGRWIRGDRGVR
jgi:signal transduction histidine kinase